MQGACRKSSAAQNTNELISRSIQSAKSGTESTDLAVSAMQDIDGCIRSIKTLMDGAAAGMQQSEMITLAKTGIRESPAAVQNSSTAAGKSAAVSGEGPCPEQPDRPLPHLTGPAGNRTEGVRPGRGPARPQEYLLGPCLADSGAAGGAAGAPGFGGNLSAVRRGVFRLFQSRSV